MPCGWRNNNSPATGRFRVRFRVRRSVFGGAEVAAGLKEATVLIPLKKEARFRKSRRVIPVTATKSFAQWLYRSILRSSRLIWLSNEISTCASGHNPRSWSCSNRTVLVSFSIMSLSAKDRLVLIRVKIERAKKHLLELQAEVNSAGRQELQVACMKTDPQTGQLRPYFGPLPISSFNLLATAGDVIQNLRSALDHLAYQLAQVGSPNIEPSRYVSFPIATTADIYKTSKASSQVCESVGAGTTGTTAIAAIATRIQTPIPLDPKCRVRCLPFVVQSVMTQCSWNGCGRDFLQPSFAQRFKHLRPSSRNRKLEIHMDGNRANQARCLILRTASTSPSETSST